VQSLTSLELLFLGVEHEHYPMDSVGIFLLDPSEVGKDFGFDRVRAELAARVGALTVFTRRVVTGPLGLSGAQWVTDPDFNIDHHVHRVAVPAPGDHNALSELVLALSTRPLDRSRPLWEVWFVEELADGMTAMILRLHHACIDGMGGMQMLGRLFDLEAHPESIPHPKALAPERMPAPMELLLRSLFQLATTPSRLLGTGTALVRSSYRAREAARGEDRGRFLGATPRMLLNRRVANPDKSLAMMSVSLDDVKRVKGFFGVTVNDVVLTMVTGGLRKYLLDRDELPDLPLNACCPVNLRPVTDESVAGNQFSMLFSRLPTNVADPVEQLRAVHRETTVNKRVAEARLTETNPAAALASIPPPNAWELFVDLLLSPLGDRLPPITNLVVSNMMGPPIPLYFAGARVTHLYGRTMVMSSVGMLIHCISFDGSMDFGITALRELVPDPDTITSAMRDHLNLLINLARKEAR
jgi:diacylglycerol O-acyltransferase / wax synthase